MGDGGGILGAASKKYSTLQIVFEELHDQNKSESFTRSWGPKQFVQYVKERPMTALVQTALSETKELDKVNERKREREVTEFS